MIPFESFGDEAKNPPEECPQENSSAWCFDTGWSGGGLQSLETSKAYIQAQELAQNIWVEKIIEFMILELIRTIIQRIFWILVIDHWYSHQ